MHYTSTTSNDGCKLAFQTSLPLTSTSGDAPNPDPRYHTLILLLHGFSGSSQYFKRNSSALSASAWVVAVDLRGHGDSGRSKGGYHVARLAADLREILAHLRKEGPNGCPTHIIPVGCSIGAAILWTYVELFGDSEFAGMVFVDQAPLQDRSPFGDWDVTKAHRGCYDEESMLAAQRAWIDTPEEAYRGLVADCLGYRYAPKHTDRETEKQKEEDEKIFMGISRKCDPTWLARLLADHTRYDHQEAIEEIRVPVLVLAGERTGCFPLEGMKETVRRVEEGQRGLGIVAPRWEVFESGHWLFWEESERFNWMIAGFVEDCVDNSGKQGDSVG